MASASPLDDADLEYDCPVCTEPFIPPIYQCNNGHMICNSCELQCKHCPVCREPMPCRKIRSLTIEKILASLANQPTQCPNGSLGCPVIVKKKEIEDHKLECAFVLKKFCSQLGLNCTQENNTSKMNKLITHFIFDHDLDGAIGEGDDSATSKLEIVQKCNRTELVQQLKEEKQSQTKGKEKLLMPNFIKFDDKIFFVKKTVNVTEKIVSIMVCLDASPNTAVKYSALIQLFPGNSDVSVSFEFKQTEVALLTDEFDTEETSRLKLCKIPFSTIEYYGKTGDSQCDDLSLKLHVSILKNLSPRVAQVLPKKTKPSNFNVLEEEVSPTESRTSPNVGSNASEPARPIPNTTAPSQRPAPGQQPNQPTPTPSSKSRSRPQTNSVPSSNINSSIEKMWNKVFKSKSTNLPAQNYN